MLKNFLKFISHSLIFLSYRLGSLSALLPTFCGFAKVAIFTTKLHTKNTLQIYEKLSYEARNRHFCQTAVTCWASLSVNALSCQVSTEPLRCPLRWLASSFYFFVRLHLAKVKIKCACKCVGVRCCLVIHC